MEEEIHWELKKFEELTGSEVYEILQLRSEVFVVEQQCAFLDMDNKDQQSYHLRGTVGKKLIAYLRILPPGLAYEQSSLGRVVCSASYRKKGAGIALMQKGIKENRSLFGNQPIVIGAQLYLQRFYENLGFEQCSESYMEDDIPHIKMVKNE